MKALAIVAHPDDETIWMGGQIIRHKYDWIIFSLCRAEDPDRCPKFYKVCKYYSAKPIITDLEDDKLYPININQIIRLIDSILKDKNYDIIYTHGKNGEYGHIRHKEIHQAVKKMVEDEILIAKKIFYFNYKKKDNYCIAIKNKNYCKLNSKELREKKRIITEMYGFKVNGFEEKTCGNEGFILK